MYRMAKKLAHIFVRLNCHILTDFRNDFIVRVRRKFVIIHSLKLAPHLVNVSVLKATVENIGQWRRRLECVVQQQGGHIEQLM